MRTRAAGEEMPEAEKPFADGRFPPPEPPGAVIRGPHGRGIIAEVARFNAVTGRGPGREVDGQQRAAAVVVGSRGGEAVSIEGKGDAEHGDRQSVRPRQGNPGQPRQHRVAQPGQRVAQDPRLGRCPRRLDAWTLEFLRVLCVVLIKTNVPFEVDLQLGRRLSSKHLARSIKVFEGHGETHPGRVGNRIVVWFGRVMKTGGDVVVIISWDVAPAHADARALPRLRLLVSVAAVAATLPSSTVLIA